MSRQHRPLRRVRGADLDRLVTGLVALVGPSHWPLPMMVHPRRYGSAWWAERCAVALGTRPALVRRCLTGGAVSARAAGKILAAACGRGRREPGR